MNELPEKFRPVFQLGQKDDHMIAFMNFELEVFKLRAKNAKLRGGLEKYGEHERDCIIMQFQEYDPAKGLRYAGEWHEKMPLCTCGLDELLTESSNGK